MVSNQILIKGNIKQYACMMCIVLIKFKGCKILVYDKIIDILYLVIIEKYLIYTFNLTIAAHT